MWNHKEFATNTPLRTAHDNITIINDYNYYVRNSKYKLTHNYCSLNNQFKHRPKLYYLANYQIFMSNLKMGAIGNYRLSGACNRSPGFQFDI